MPMPMLSCSRPNRQARFKSPSRVALYTMARVCVLPARDLLIAVSRMVNQSTPVVNSSVESRELEGDAMGVAYSI